MIDVAVVGGGPAGLAAAIELRRRGVASVTVVEREARAGGVPRHADHTGFGFRDLHRVERGPRYAERYRERARAAGARLLEETQATGWTDDGALELTSPRGRESLHARAVLLATGCRERPRAARLVPGDRTAGVLTTGELQQRVHLMGQSLPGRAIVIGAEHVSFSAVETLRRGGARTLGLVTERDRHQSVGLFRAGARLRFGARLWTKTRVASLVGASRLEAVELVDLESGARRAVDCELAVFTADWVPDAELAHAAGCLIDPGTQGPLVGPDARTSKPGLWSAGNLVHPAETADIAALGGRHAGAAIATQLRAAAHAGDSRTVAVRANSPLLWVVPGLAGSAAGVGAPARGRFLLRGDAFLRRPALTVRQGDRVLWKGHLRRLTPGRSAAIPADWQSAVDLDGEAVTVGVG